MWWISHTLAGSRGIPLRYAQCNLSLLGEQRGFCAFLRSGSAVLLCGWLGLYVKFDHGTFSSVAIHSTLLFYTIVLWSNRESSSDKYCTRKENRGHINMWSGCQRSGVVLQIGDSARKIWTARFVLWLLWSYRAFQASSHRVCYWRIRAMVAVSPSFSRTTVSTSEHHHWFRTG